MKIKNINPECVLYIKTDEKGLNTYIRHSKKKWSIYNFDYVAEKYVQELEEAFKDYFFQQDLACQETKEFRR